MVPAQVVPDVMEECAKIGVKAVIIITAGFKEVGEEGQALEQRDRPDRRRSPGSA